MEDGAELPDVVPIRPYLCPGCGARVTLPVGQELIIRGKPEMIGGSAVGLPKSWSFSAGSQVLHRCPDWSTARGRTVLQGSAGGVVLPMTAGSTLSKTAAKGKRCAVPGCARRDLTRDHIVPKCRGGLGMPDNIQILCRPHNEMKADLDQAEFQALLGVTW
jgi:hypothetical protein